MKPLVSKVAGFPKIIGVIPWIKRRRCSNFKLVGGNPRCFQAALVSRLWFIYHNIPRGCSEYTIQLGLLESQAIVRLPKLSNIVPGQHLDWRPFLYSGLKRKGLLRHPLLISTLISCRVQWFAPYVAYQFEMKVNPCYYCTVMLHRVASERKCTCISDVILVD